MSKRIVTFPTVELPWEQSRISIYNFVLSNQDDDAFLPDEHTNPNGLHYAAGLVDTMISCEKSDHELELDACSVIISLCRFCEDPNSANLADFYDQVALSRCGTIFDYCEAELRKRAPRPPALLYPLAKWLVLNAPDREAVKFGICLLGLIGSSEDEDLMLTIGSHDEFTWFALNALLRRSSDAEDVLFQLAKRVHGWGRIHLVEQLAETTRPEIRTWLLRHGYRNSIMPIYTAMFCAKAGRLQDELRADHIDDELFTAATEIISALLSDEGPADGFGECDADYADNLFSNLLRHTQSRASLDLLHLEAVNDIFEWVSERAGTYLHESEILAACSAIRARPAWRAIVTEALDHGSDSDFWCAKKLAGFLGIDKWPYCFERARNDKNAHLFFSLMDTSDEARIDSVLALLREQFCLEELASGPAEERGLGREYAAHQELGIVLQELRKWSGMGRDLLMLGLRSPVIRNRNMALMALQQWGVDYLDPEVLAALEDLKRIEPVDKTRELVQQVINLAN